MESQNTEIMTGSVEIHPAFVEIHPAFIERTYNEDIRYRVTLRFKSVTDLALNIDKLFGKLAVVSFFGWGTNEDGTLEFLTWAASSGTFEDTNEMWTSHFGKKVESVILIE